MKRLAGLMAGAMILMGACGGDSPALPPGTVGTQPSPTHAGPTTAAQSPTATPSSTPTPAPKPSAELVWTFFSQSERFFRALVVLKNPADRAITGVQLRWDALDKDGVLVGSLPSRQPDIPAGGSIFYAAGAGSINLTGPPASLKVTVTEGGRFTDASVSPLVTEAVSFEKAAFPSLSKAPNNYRVAGNVAIGANPVPISALSVVAVLRDAQGIVVGASFVSPPNGPDSLPAGTKIRVESTSVDATASASAVELYAYVRP